MKVLLDTMSGDVPPREIIKGAVRALQETGDEGLGITLVGKEDVNRELVEEFEPEKSLERISYLHASSMISMEDTPAKAARRNPDSSLVKGIKALEDDSEIFISSGNTGAVVAAALFNLGRIPGVERPGLAGVVPTVDSGNVVLIDIGATTDASPKNLAQFGMMGKVLSEIVKGEQDPGVGVLNIGEEQTKGNKLTKKAVSLLRESELEYAGNVEPHLLLTDPPADVVICEGFVGNILIKSFEGAVDGTIGFFKKAISSSLRSKLGGLVLRPTLKSLKNQLSYSQFGAVPLLGVNGVVYVAHGRSGERAIKNAIINAREASRWDLPGKIESEIDRVDFSD
ncbi:phosphate acyltransferase PlsX [Candidatus Bipolaricaulota bacterium]|nr:phosphate acyltransferase PlsX [Candidatus Bipolaricaulota bacterium]